MSRDLIEKEIKLYLIDIIYPFISDLTSREKAVLQFRNNGDSMESIGERFKVSRERINQIEKKALEKLRYQKEIISGLAKLLSASFFSSDDIAKSFDEWHRDNLHIRDFTEINGNWRIFNEILLKNSTKV